MLAHVGHRAGNTATYSLCCRKSPNYFFIFISYVLASSHFYERRVPRPAADQIPFPVSHGAPCCGAQGGRGRSRWHKVTTTGQQRDLSAHLSASALKFTTQGSQSYKPFNAAQGRRMGCPSAHTDEHKLPNISAKDFCRHSCIQVAICTTQNIY